MSVRYFAQILCVVTAFGSAGWAYHLSSQSARRHAILAVKQWRANDLSWARVDNWLKDTTGQKCEWKATRPKWVLGGFLVSCTLNSENILIFATNASFTEVRSANDKAKAAMKEVETWSKVRRVYP